MHEFDLIKKYFISKDINHDDQCIILGIGDDAACINIPNNEQLVISTDTLIENVHFFSYWDPYHIAYKAVMVNISDIVAMAAYPKWISLALTMPHYDEAWLKQFSLGLFTALEQYNIKLIGGDTTRGSLSITITIHGLVKKDCYIPRNGAQIGDIIFVSGQLGAAALALNLLKECDVDDILHSDLANDFSKDEFLILFNKLQQPTPRIDLNPILSQYASALIDISDGLSADLNHICAASNVGACIDSNSLPIHELVIKYCPNDAIDLVLTGGDDYELCFTVAKNKLSELQKILIKNNLHCYAIGSIEKDLGLRVIGNDGIISAYMPSGYSHF